MKNMPRINEILEFLKTLMYSSNHETFQINKGSLSEIQTCLYNAQEKIVFLQLESQLQQEELKQRNHHFELVSVQNIETTTHQHQVDNVIVHSDLVPNKSARLHAYAEVQLAFSKPIIRPWEELVHNKHKTGLGYDKDVSFHIPDYSKPIQFQSYRFLQDGSSSPAPHDSSPLAVSDSGSLP